MQTLTISCVYSPVCASYEKNALINHNALQYLYQHADTNTIGTTKFSSPSVNFYHQLVYRLYLELEPEILTVF